VAEVKVQMSNYAAEFGTAAINVQAVTRQGSSEFHGSAYDYLRAHQFAANERARNYAHQERPETKFQYPGFTLPVRSSSREPASTRTATRRSSSSDTNGSARRWPRTQSAAWSRRRACGRASSTISGPAST